MNKEERKVAEDLLLQEIKKAKEVIRLLKETSNE